MDAVYVGWLSILPPVIAIILALITKEVLFSLITGILSGTRHTTTAQYYRDLKRQTGAC